MKPVAAVLSVVLGSSAALLSFAGLMATAVALSEITGSGLFGICGPYGDAWSIDVQMVTIAVAVFACPMFGVFVARRMFRTFSSPAA